MYIDLAYRIHCKTGLMVTTLGLADTTDYLRCDGRAVRKQDYPELYAVIGDAYSDTANLGSGQFRVPDLRSGSLASSRQPNQMASEEYVEIDGNEWTMRELERVTTPDGWD